MLKWLRQLFGWDREPGPVEDLPSPYTARDAEKLTGATMAAEAPSAAPLLRPQLQRELGWDYLAEGQDVVVIDTETTGTSRHDRIVSFAGIVLLAPDYQPADWLHLVFNPGRPSHPMAARVHGLSDVYLARQPSFAAHGKQIKAFLKGRPVAGYNVAFDLRMLDQSLRAVGMPGFGRRDGTYCVMEEWCYRRQVPSAKLDDVLRQIGLRRTGAHHGAFEDAALTAAVLQWLHGHQDLRVLNAAAHPFQNAVA